MFNLRKSIVLIPMFAAVCLTQAAFAKDKPLELSKSCIKDYPLASGDSSGELIQLYSQLCDKKNKKNAELLTDLQTQIAQKYQAEGFNLKALQTVNELRGKNINSPALTDVTILASSAIAQNAINYMRTSESRFLTDETYAQVSPLADTIRFAKPETVIAEQKANSSSSKQRNTYKTTVKTTSSNKSAKSASNTSGAKNVKEPVKNTKPAAAVKEKEQPQKTAKPTGASPFETLNKKK